MSARIPQAFIQELIARTDIIEIIQSRISLVKRGRNYQARCPFHDEKTPSFSVNADKQFYYCFGCSANGNVISFLMNYDRMEFLDAIEYLAEKNGLELPKEKESPQQSNKALYPLMETITAFYQQQLRQSDVAINYLKGRGISGQVAKAFSLGFAPPGWDNLQRYINDPSKKQDLLQTGMLIEKNPSRCYDRFRNRLLFPIRDTRGRVIAFGGRTLSDEKPKYLNSPETAIFHKSQELYGLYECRQSLKSIEQILLVEGYMDVISLVQHQIHYSVATLGTAISSRHIQKLLRYSNCIVYCFDGDQAGNNAAWKALQMSLPLLRDGIEFRFLFLPDGDDPDSLVRKIGSEQFHLKVQQAQPISDVLFDTLKKQHNLQSIDGKSQCAKAALELIDTMPDGIYRTLLLEQLAKLLRMQVDDLTRAHTEQNQALAQNQASPTTPEVKSLKRPLQMALTLLLKHPQLCNNPINLGKLTTINSRALKIFIQILQIFRRHPGLPIGQLLTYFEDKKIQQWISQLTANDIMIPESGYSQEFDGAISRIIEQAELNLANSLITKAKQQGLSPAERQQLTELLQQNKIDIEQSSN